ncbi:related to quinate transport protein [Fusarium oxysporum]|uniref:Related to quinate transport protein n=1 Tax=Fusarium oxysporum TaxID=5507 RepID=A0A2H3SNF3_FUSOX|nr:related to quinate transport protein [Fusarium oxysporum]
MAITKIFTESVLAKYARTIKATPRGLIVNRSLLFSCAVYALAGLPTTWDQGSSSVVPSLPGFQKQFNIESGAKADDIQDFISIIYIGYAVGAALSFFINDRIGRRWSFRLYSAIWIIGQLIATLSPGWPALYTARIISGIGIGSLSVTGPMSIVELAPSKIRGLLTAWYTVVMGTALFTSIFCVYGIFLHMSSSKLQYQIVWFSPAIFMALAIVASFFVSESPRWLMMVGKREEAAAVLVDLRRLPADHPRLQKEIKDIEDSVTGIGSSFTGIVKETFTVPSNLRRLQQALLSYALAQLSGANSVTSYFIPIMSIMGIGGGTSESMFLSGMYGFSKFIFSLIASFFFIDALGRRRSLFIGITLQLISHVYIGVFIKYHQEGPVSSSASQAAIAAVFFHAFGYAVGLFVLPYIFGGELWPNRLRSFGGAVSQTFHWLFIYAVKYSIPSLLKTTDNWGAFLFFAGWCFLALIYVFFMVPEISGLSVEEIDYLFKGSWFNAYKRARRHPVIDSVEDGKNKLPEEPGSKNLVPQLSLVKGNELDESLKTSR